MGRADIWVHEGDRDAPLLTYREQETQRFRVTATVAANGDISFELCYEELLQRRLGAYRYAVAIHPRQVVAELRVELSITERAGISALRVLPFQPADTWRGTATTVTTPSVEVTAP